MYIRTQRALAVGVSDFAFLTSLENVLNVKTRIIKRTNAITIRLKIIIVVIFHHPSVL